MRNLSSAILTGLLATGSFILATGCGGERVGVGVAVASGPPVCPYGYYEVPPYNCAPDGYYGPEWFSGGLFVGAGPWYHGPAKSRIWDPPNSSGRRCDR